MGLFDFLFGKSKKQASGHSKANADARLASFPFDAQARQNYDELLRLITQVVSLSMQINTRSPLCAFIEIAGHVNTLDVTVAKDKDDGYNVNLYEKSIDYRYLYAPGEEYYDAEEERMFYAEAVRELQSVITRLNEFLKQHKIEGPVRIEDKEAKELSVLYPADAAAVDDYEKVMAAVTGIVNTAMRINSNSEYAVFFDIAGHVNSIEVSVRKSKEEYNDTIFEEEMDYELWLDLEGPETMDEAGFFREEREKAETLLRKLGSYLSANPGFPGSKNEPVPITYE